MMATSALGTGDRVRKGVYLALATALVSGVSIFVNKFAVTGLKDPVVLAGAKNALVAGVLIGSIILAGKATEIARLTRRQAAALLAIGIVGGGIPFILFFRGLALSEAASAAFIHKTLFVWVALLAVPLLGERLGRWQIAAVGVLVAGNLALLAPRSWTPSPGDLLVFIATLLWAVETIVARRLLRGTVSAGLAAAARMTLGSVLILGYLGFSGGLGGLSAMGGAGLIWLLVTAAFLVAYVTTWYAALKRAPAAVVTSILVIGSPITTLLGLITAEAAPGSAAVAGAAVLAAGVAVFVVATFKRAADSPKRATA